MIGRHTCTWNIVFLGAALALIETCKAGYLSGEKKVDGSGKNVLVFGGNGFMGASTVQGLIQDGYSVTIVNRGNWYWDSRYRIKPHVHSIICDRKKPLRGCKELLDKLEGLKLHAVVDFSAYGPYEVQQAISTLTAKNVGMYVYISSDSVYEVCIKNHDGPSVETDAVRPTDEDIREEMSSKDSYGNRKLQGEEVLSESVQQGGFPYVALRLPDVVGPRDSTYRWWIYQLWIRMNDYVDKTISLPRYLNNYPMSLVYVEDVAKVILNIIALDESRFETIKNEAFNLAHPETLTLNQLFDGIRERTIDSKFNYTLDESNNAIYLFPSVKKGPINVTKAELHLNWNPTPWETVFSQTVKFYEDVMIEPGYGQQRTEIINILAREIIYENRSLFYKGIQELYNLDLGFHDIKDEL
ncbi:unnamed protein product [Owenia fusiformis]|uniref:Uncharacterized protein n=1 Tax=Owenia fusiformis TaxID=6347 RepID=A0A8J1XK71_OWEFU|nr:unnamed protein product [Owenia fusiformis]